MYNPYYQPVPERPRIAYSRTEVLHLAAAVAVLTVAFSFVNPATRGWIPQPFTVFSSFVAVSSGFVLHELAHKVVAQRYGHWAEFRAHPLGLGLALAIAVLAKILFAAPGAVLIRGAVTRKENGVISLVGPGTNLLIATASGLPLLLMVDTTTKLYTLVRTVALVNAALAVFNLIPAGPLDGKKVWQWNKPVYLLMLATGILLFLLILIGWP
jgi:Zn-dependent protease